MQLISVINNFRNTHILNANSANQTGTSHRYYGRKEQSIPNVSCKATKQYIATKLPVNKSYLEARMQTLTRLIEKEDLQTVYDIHRKYDYEQQQKQHYMDLLLRQG